MRSYWGGYDEHASESIKKLTDDSESTLKDFLNDDKLTNEIKSGNEKLLLM